MPGKIKTGVATASAYHALSNALPFLIQESTMNVRWHELNVMPKRAALAARLRWHLAHQKHCACRPLPASIAAALKAKAPNKSAIERAVQPMPADVERALS